MRTQGGDGPTGKEQAMAQARRRTKDAASAAARPQPAMLSVFDLDRTLIAGFSPLIGNTNRENA